jgi:hypothetical protein
VKVLNVSPHRSGTRSFHAFCIAHGLTSAHWPEAAFDQACQRALEHLDEAALWEVSAAHFETGEVFSDLPCPLIYRQALAAWPEARFVLVRRDPAAWIASVRRHAAGRNLSYLEKFFYWSVCGGRPARIDAYSDASLTRGYSAFMQHSEAYLRQRGARVRSFELGSAELGRELAAFIGFEARYPFVRITD